MVLEDQSNDVEEPVDESDEGLEKEARVAGVGEAQPIKSRLCRLCKVGRKKRREVASD